MAAASAPPDRSDAAPGKADPVLDAILALVKRDEVKVPPIPAVVGKLSEQLKNTEIDLRAVTSMVGTDQALSAHILRCASHTLLASRAPITSLNEAVMRVGTNGLFSLVVSFCLGRDASRTSPLQSVRRDVFRRAAATAEFCRRMAASHSADPDGAFLCGLLGSFGLTVALGAVEQVLTATRMQQSRSADAWMQIARRCDEESASSVAAKWGMPRLVTDVITARRSGEGDPSLAPYVKLLERAERLTELFYREAAPSEQDIVQATGCTPAAAAEIATFLPQVASSVHALNSAADDAKPPASVPILVEAPPTTLRGELVPASIPVTVERKGGDHQIVCVGLAADGFAAHGTQPLPLNQVVKCVMLGVEEDLELVAFVAGVSRHDNEYRFEMKPMGLVGGHATKWQKLRIESARQFSANEALDVDAMVARDARAEERQPDAEPRRERRESPRPASEAPRPRRESPRPRRESPAAEAVEASAAEAVGLDFGPLQAQRAPESSPESLSPEEESSSPQDASDRAGSSGPPREGHYVSLKNRPSVFRRFADWINGRDIE